MITSTPSPKSESTKLNANESAKAAPTSVSAPDTVPCENVSSHETSSTDDPTPTHAPFTNVGITSPTPGIDDTAPAAAAMAAPINSPLFLTTSREPRADRNTKSAKVITTNASEATKLSN